MSKYKGLFTFDVDNHRYLPVEQADGTIGCMNYHPELEMPKEPLIKDEKIRKALKAWFVANEIGEGIECHTLTAGTRFSCGNYCIEFLGFFIYDLIHGQEYTIAELCGEEEG